jgi:hypothetical protein
LSRAPIVGTDGAPLLLQIIVTKTIVGPVEVAGEFGSNQSKLFFHVSRVFQFCVQSAVSKVRWIHCHRDQSKAKRRDLRL